MTGQIPPHRPPPPGPGPHVPVALHRAPRRPSALRRTLRAAARAVRWLLIAMGALIALPAVVGALYDRIANHPPAKEHAMHTCTHTPAEPKLFDPGPVLVEFTGIVAGAPETRTRSDHGRPVPVLCVELHSVGPHGNTIHAELPFAECDRKAAEAQAHALRPGQRVAVVHPAHALRLSLPHAVSVTPIPPSAD